MQGVIYGVHTDQVALDSRLRTRFDIDECFGTVIYRYVAQAVIGFPLTVYGAGEQVRGFIALGFSKTTFSFDEKKHFEEEAGGILLKEAGRKIFVGAFDERLKQTIQHPSLDQKVSYRGLIRLELYKQAVDKLLADGKAYPCYCTEVELEDRRRDALKAGAAPRYDNRCRGLSKEQIAENNAKGQKAAIRFQVDPGPVEFTDLIRGQVTVDASLFGDFVIVRQDGIPTFHLSVCVDDGAMKISHVIRGEDHLSNTPRHILLFRALGYELPQFAHLPLIMGQDGKLLSKRLGSSSIAEYRNRGYLPQALVNYLSLLGWSDPEEKEIFGTTELAERFELERVNKSAASFDPVKLDWVAGEHIRLLSDEDFAAQVKPYVTVDFTVPDQGLILFKAHIQGFGQINSHLGVFNPDLQPSEEWASELENKRALVLAALEWVHEKGVDSYKEMVNFVKEKSGFKGKELFRPLRLALTGAEHGPELALLTPILGVEICAKRLEKALELCPN